MSILSNEELKRYSRHLTLKDFGVQGQEKLKQASVLVVGAGGLGCPALMFLAAAGIGKMGIADFDVVQESNLQRQVLYTVKDIGKNKAEAAKERLRQLNPWVELEIFPFQLSSHNATEILRDFDVIIDGSDNFPTRYLLNDACILLNKPLVYGSVQEYEGQVAVFNVCVGNHYTANYRDIFPTPPPRDQVPNCEQAGVLGIITGIVGVIQANEAIKFITGKGDLLSNKLLLIDSQSMDFSTIQIKSTNSRDQIKELIDYEMFCSNEDKKIKSPTMKEITVQELQQLRQSNEEFQLIDVREEYEYETANLEGESIPLAEIPEQVDRVSRIKKVIIHCKSGSRSAQAIQWLEKNHNFENLYNLKGGITAWAKEIDPSITV